MTIAMNERTDHATLSYVDAARPVQALLQQVLTQVAGFSLMLMTKSRKADGAEGALVVARMAADRALDQLRALKVPARAAHHHHHLRKAWEATGWAFSAAEACIGPNAGDGEREDLTRALGAASEHLRATSRLLPGFEMVDFGQACCAMHAAAPETMRSE